MIWAIVCLLLTLSTLAAEVCSLSASSYFGTRMSGSWTHRHRRQGLAFSPASPIHYGRRDASDSTRSVLYMGMKVNIRIVGRKTSEPWLEEGVEMYEKRLRPSNVEVETTWHKDNAALIKGVDADRSKNHKVILLDPTGTQPTSEKFSEKVYQWLDEGGSRLSFIIGGAEGLPAELKYPSYSSGKKSKDQAPMLISLSAMTFTHQFARLLLIEQIYRATEIQKGSGYHK
ncbi:unnamed protein product [Pseudo-nitzschia multistriata]|uniref:Ribosomal RNA large subunit methyltransferase H n=1 Tax=Pseudo-nitzschia multistriata TaxID=183589 RepID=A0A448ZHA3_9STRA|nr:unnamed protein product [Pseudo-nitzschia multistriata]